MGPQKSIRRKKGDAANSRLQAQTSNLLGNIILWNFAGIVVCILCGGAYACLVCQIHEARMFFIGITEVEREISFRTENGLYYSYYKQLVQAPSFWKGLHDLMEDKLTEHPSVINILSRMNVYQEVLLAAAYRFIPYISSTFEPVFFYIYFVFALHGMLVSSIYVMSWLISGTWLAGCLAVLFYTLNSPDVTRVETYMPLRENFSLPCLWLQLLIITIYFKSDVQDRCAKVCEKGLMVTTFFFALMWQFNQFALLLQAMALFGCQALNVVSSKKILHVYLCQLLSMIVVSALQFCNTMILSGFLISFIVASIVVMKIQEESPQFNPCICKVASLVLSILGVFVITMLVNFSLKKIFQQEADEHINRFLMTKFGFNSSIDFDVRLYLCNGGFNFLSWDFFARLSVNLTFPLYLIAHIVLLVLLGITTFKGTTSLDHSKVQTNTYENKNFLQLSPELCYHSIQMVFFGAVGIIALRMKYFWTPYMCVFASACLFMPRPWLWIAGKLNYSKSTQVNLLQTAVGIIVISVLALMCYRDISAELNNMREFYDPNTVELMNWINDNTEEASSFSGSMQLMAGVKLCTGRPITNHPHYEDKGLRLKTKELYKYYGRYTAEEVHSILKKYQTDYIILEDSICLVPLRDGCGLPYIMDMDSGLELDSTGKPLHAHVLPRFCDQIRKDQLPYSKLFKLVLENKTFRVYKVL